VKIIRTVQCCIVYHAQFNNCTRTQYSYKHTHTISSSHGCSSVAWFRRLVCGFLSVFVGFSYPRLIVYFVFFVVFLVYILLFVLSCQYQCKSLPVTTHLPNDLLCVSGT